MTDGWTPSSVLIYREEARPTVHENWESLTWPHAMELSGVIQRSLIDSHFWICFGDKLGVNIDPYGDSFGIPVERLGVARDVVHDCISEERIEDDGVKTALARFCEFLEHALRAGQEVAIVT
jgi:hypothetical protein